jgi:hypothetical protein
MTFEIGLVLLILLATLLLFITGLGLSLIYFILVAIALPFFWPLFP